MSTPSQGAAALEHLAAYRFREIADAEEMAEVEQSSALSGARALSRPAAFVLLHMIVFEECTNQWSLSRPLLALILINEENYEGWKQQAVSSLAPHPQRQQKLALAFEKLMQEVPRGKQANLDVKTRDRFTQNLSQFRHEVRSLV